VREPGILERLTHDQRSKTIHGLGLIARVGLTEDIAACYTLHRSLGLPYTDASWRALPHMWHYMLSKGTMKLFLVEDRSRRLGSRIVSFNAIVFVTDKFCLEARSTLPPYLSVQLARQYLLHQLPVLNREHIALANAHDGLNVVMCFEGSARDGIWPEQVLLIRAKQDEALHLALRGYRIKEFLAEPIEWEMSKWMLDAGARLRRTYSNYFGRNHFLRRKSPQRPCLVGLTKTEALAHPGGNIAGLFIYTAPRFHFNRSQRMLLQHALLGGTCDTLARSLSLSPWTVKKRWRAIYDRVGDVDKELLPASTAYGAHATSRGAECRRHLLNYLRQHLEELRPYEPPKRRINT
jgi:DNA-binding CsgD family transcriptional regulator